MQINKINEWAAFSINRFLSFYLIFIKFLMSEREIFHFSKMQIFLLNFVWLDPYEGLWESNIGVL